MKVGLVCPYAWDLPGGVRTHVADLALALGDHGHEVSILAPAIDASTLPEYVVDGVARSPSATTAPSRG